MVRAREPESAGSGVLADTASARAHGAQANAVLKDERGSLALDGQVGLLLHSLASDSGAVRATALQARARRRLLIRAMSASVCAAQ